MRAVELDVGVVVGEIEITRLCVRFPSTLLLPLLPSDTRSLVRAGRTWTVHYPVIVRLTSSAGMFLTGTFSSSLWDFTERFRDGVPACHDRGILEDRTRQVDLIDVGRVA